MQRHTLEQTDGLFGDPVARRVCDAVPEAQHDDGGLGAAHERAVKDVTVARNDVVVLGGALLFA